MTTPHFPDRDAHGAAAQFVAGTLTGDSLERFEEHLLTCAECQSEVRLGLRIRAAGIPAAATTHRSRRVLRWLVPVAAIAATVLFLVRPDSDRTALMSLGGIEAAPIYLGIPVRDEDSDTLFDAAMAAYQRSDFAEALQTLETLAAQTAPPVHFFRGASALMLNRNPEAIDAFSDLLALPESPYHAEAHYYRAKAYLRRGDASAALSDLRAITDSGLHSRASALADSIEAAVLR